MKTKATWTNGKRTVKGCWHYNWSAGRFVIELGLDPITGEKRRIFVQGEVPEWGNWKRVKSNTEKGN